MTRRKKYASPGMPTLLTTAADLLEEYAEILWDSNVIRILDDPNCGKLDPDEPALIAEYKKLVETAAQLRRATAYWKVNPLGGPGSVFIAMAGRIQSGEDYHSVLDDYGFKVAKR